MENTNNGKGLSIAGLVLGIVAVVFALLVPANIGWIGLIVGVVGIILAVLGRKKATEAGAPTGMATAGLVLSIIGTALAGIFWLACMLCIKTVSDTLSNTNFNDLANQLSK